MNDRDDRRRDDPFVPSRPRQSSEIRDEVPNRATRPADLPDDDPFSPQGTAPEYRPPSRSPSRTSNKPPLGPEASIDFLPPSKGAGSSDRVAVNSTAIPAPRTAANPSELDKIPTAVREELDQFAHATLQVQRVKLLQERGMQKTLGLTPQQITALSAVNREVEAMSKTLQSMAPQERDQRLKGEFRDMSQKFETLVDSQLNEQQQRILFREAVRRQQGAVVFLLPGVSQELQLSDPQLAFLYRRIDETRRNVDLNNLYNPLELAKLFRLAREGRQMAEDQLTASQKVRFQSLLAKN